MIDKDMIQDPCQYYSTDSKYDDGELKPLHNIQWLQFNMHMHIIKERRTLLPDSFHTHIYLLTKLPTNSLEQHTSIGFMQPWCSNDVTWYEWRDIILWWNDPNVRQLNNYAQSGSHIHGKLELSSFDTERYSGWDSSATFVDCINTVCLLVFVEYWSL